MSTVTTEQLRKYISVNNSFFFVNNDYHDVATIKIGRHKSASADFKQCISTIGLATCTDFNS